MITYAWTVDSLDCIPSTIDNKTNVISCVHWRVNAVDDTPEANKATIYGTQDLNTDNITDFTPYKDIKEEDIISWVKNSMGEEVDIIEKRLESIINDLANPSIISPPFPWGNNLTA
jgi:hypothetical protein